MSIYTPRNETIMFPKVFLIFYPHHDIKTILIILTLYSRCHYSLKFFCKNWQSLDKIVSIRVDRTLVKSA